MRAVPTPKSRPQSGSTEPNELWLHRSHSIPEDRLNGWVISLFLESYLKEDVVMKACEKASLQDRLEACGLQEFEDKSVGLRKRCLVLKNATDVKHELLAEIGQRHMLASISESLRSYMSGIRCWAAFNDALGDQVHFPATEARVIQWASVFTSGATYEQYLRMSNEWYTQAAVQVKKGLCKQQANVRKRIALHKKDVVKMVKLIEAEEPELGGLLAVARLFLLRVPSEAVPMQWCGSHSTVQVDEAQLTIVLARRKNRPSPTT